MEQALIAAGLTKQQAHAYIFILDHFPASPAEVATHLKLSRTNAYKVADKLVELGLVNKEDLKKKVVYSPNDPVALSGLVAEARNKMIALEKATKDAMRIMQSRKVAENQADAKVYKGRAAVIELFKEQAATNLDLHSLHTRADIPIMGFAAMNQIRHLWAGKRGQRYALTPDAPGAANNKAIDARTNLIRTWIPRDAYTAPVEWSVCGDTLNLYVYDSEPYAISLRDKHVAAAFKQIWHMIDDSMRTSKAYKGLPKYADRTV